MTLAADTFTWAAHETALKAWLDMAGDSTYDAQLRLYLEAAAKDCDDYCGWHYTDADDEIVDATPSDPAAEPLIKLGIYEWVKAALAAYRSPASAGVKMSKTGQLQENYGGDVYGLSAAKAGQAAGRNYWGASVYNPLRIAK